ncbi:MAG: hypothetical protein RLZZ65_966 [Bacteroidota bacterium]|jgi:hypothetical protein
MQKRHLLFGLLWGLVSSLQAQISDSSLYAAFKNGVTKVRVRSFFSETTNEGALSDYYAWAIGGGLSYETQAYHHFQLCLGGFYGFHLASSDLSKPDLQTGVPNRYEIGLFDQVHPGQYQDLNRLEELYLKWNNNYGKITIGRQAINTPLINLQDGRMSGTYVQGLWFDETLFSKRLHLQGGLLNGILVRGANEWRSAANSIGINGQGVTLDGSPSNYKGNIASPFIGVAALDFSLGKKLTYQAWNYWLPNVLNVTLQQLDLSHKIKRVLWVNSGQLLREWALANGGNADPTKAYIDAGSKALAFGLRSKMQFQKWHYSINFNRITAEGRYVFPREWGRDPFFTFLPRERNEGYANVTACALKLEYMSSNSMLKKSGFGIGYYRMPDVKDFAFNKYGIPSYLQANLDLRYNLNDLLTGLEAQLLLVYKYGIGETYSNLKYEINKVNMFHTSFVLNFHF